MPTLSSTIREFINRLLLHPDLSYRNKSTIKSLNELYTQNPWNPDIRRALRQLLERSVQTNKRIPFQIAARKKRILNNVLYYRIQELDD